MFRSYSLAALALTLVAWGAWAQEQDVDRPGKVTLIRPDQLPPPNQTPSARNPPTVVAQPNGATLQAPPGFRVELFHDGKIGGDDSPREMEIAPNGDVFVANGGENLIEVLRDANGDGKAEERFSFASQAEGLNRPFGLAFREGFLYVGNTNGVVRFPYQAGQTKAAGAAEQIVRDIPTGGHWTRNLAFRADGQKFYLSVGSESNVGEEEPRRAAIHEYNPDGSGFRIFASGLRNPVGLAFHPTTNELWTTVNERDELGDNLVPDYLAMVRDGGFYGWPYSYIGANLDPRMNGKGQDLAAKAIVPEVLFQAHSASLGFAFYTGAMFPQEMQGDAFVAFHGSWNRATPTGFKLVRVRFQNGKPVGGYEDFVTGWRTADGQVWGRPVGVTVARDGALLVSDDGGNRVWRVSFTPQ